jgi:type II secretory pathway pseudopilin PulG
MRACADGRRGAALLEVLIALAILGGTGVAFIGALAEPLAAAQREAARERTLASADRVLAAMTLLARDDLDLRLGRRDVGEFTTSVDRTTPVLYRIGVAERAAPDRELLVTVVHRPRASAR